MQSLYKAFDLFIEFKFCERDFYFLTGSKNRMAATNNFDSVYTLPTYYQSGYSVDTKLLWPQGYVWWVLIVRQNHSDFHKLQFFFKLHGGFHY